MVMVDTLWQADKGQIISGLKIVADLIFVEETLLREAGILEHVAQTAALGAGYGSRQSGQELHIGFIGSYKDVHILQLPTIGEELRTTLTLKYEIQNCTAYDALVACGTRQIAHMEIKLFLQ